MGIGMLRQTIVDFLIIIEIWRHCLIFFFFTIVVVFFKFEV